MQWKKTWNWIRKQLCFGCCDSTQGSEYAPLFEEGWNAEAEFDYLDPGIDFDALDSLLDSLWEGGWKKLQDSNNFAEFDSLDLGIYFDALDSLMDSLKSTRSPSKQPEVARGLGGWYKEASKSTWLAQSPTLTSRVCDQSTDFPRTDFQLKTFVTSPTISQGLMFD
ncbi:hypothetical protein JTE90_013516 [Oedothorax gibbosus]|uniref:Uncharacterized protein n=1 Tax=Oedothorax gibbosus TaxID=931172 RepID=A0AAV6VPE5_9ARAC|nr:hypothetical protein JTE90_013516 [Oedothorax gibbosus]